MSERDDDVTHGESGDDLLLFRGRILERPRRLVIVEGLLINLALFLLVLIVAFFCWLLAVVVL